MKGRLLAILLGLYACTDEQKSITIQMDTAEQSAGTTTEDLRQLNLKGLTILNRAARVHGDITDSTLVLSISIRCQEGIHRGQSLVVDPPYERYDLESRFYINRPQGEEIGHFMNRFAGFVFENKVIVNEEYQRNYDQLTNKYSEAASAGFNSFRYFPHKYINKALSNPKQVSYAGNIMLNRVEAEQVITGSGSGLTKLSFDKTTGYLLRIETLVNYPPYGDGISFKEFSDYVRLGNLMLPQVIESGSDYEAWGHVVNRFELSLIDNKTKPVHSEHAGFELSNYSKGSRNELVELGANNYMIQNITSDTKGDGYNIMFAVFEEIVIIGEAPVDPSISRQVIERIRTITDKPIQYLVQTHHHSDHWGGIRTYIAEGTTIVTTPGNQEMLERIAKASSVLQPDAQTKSPQPLYTKLVEYKLEISDAQRTAIVYDIGPTNHANEMLITYFPEQGILWQADLIKLGSWSLDDPRTDHLKNKIRELNLNVKVIAGVHGNVMQGKVLEDWLN